jgi:hypothetical protein
MEPMVSIVIAVKDGAQNVPALLDTLRDGGDAEVFLCCAGEEVTTADTNVVQHIFPSETLVPILWSEGIVRARGSRVALTTAQFVPDANWLSRLRAADLDRWVGVGGAIDNDPSASAKNWAIFFLRYSAFAPPLTAGETDEIAADNAVYDRSAILEYRDLLRDGFWEPSFHRRFRATGKKLALDPELVVVHHGTVFAQSFAQQRYLHGRAYGRERAERAGFSRNLILLLSSPLITPLLLARIIARITKRSSYRAKLFSAFPWLVRFTFAWALGEAGGYASILFSSRGPAATSSKRHA